MHTLSRNIELSDADSLRLLSVIAVVFCIIAIISNKTAQTTDSKLMPEPPYALVRVPYLSHLYGLITKRLRYIASIKAPAGICTIAIPGLPRVYVATGIDQVQEINKKTNDISFAAVTSRACCRLAGLSPQTKKLMLSNPAACDINHPSFFTECRRATNNNIVSGPSHHALLRALGDQMGTLFNKVLSQVGETMPLYSWLQQHISLVVLEVIYGPDHPFVDQKLLDAFWAFNSSSAVMASLPKSVLPYVASKGYEGRERVVAAFVKYLEAGKFATASEIVISRQRIMDKYAVGWEDRARVETINCIAILENTVPLVYWTICNTFSDPKLLAEARLAAQKYTCLTTPTPTVDLVSIRRDPVLMGIFTETLRLSSNTSEVRFVHDQDTSLSCGYRLRRNSLILMPSRSVHMDPSICKSASPPSVFDHTRFWKQGSAKQASFTPPGYRLFGSGESLCPGRQLAAAEILGVLSLFVLCFDLKEITHGGGMPKLLFNQLSLGGLGRPEREIWVTPTLRRGSDQL